MLLDCENEMRELETIHFLLNCLFSSLQVSNKFVEIFGRNLVIFEEKLDYG